jgi:hypothetical protein
VIREMRRPRPDARENEAPRMRNKPAPVIIVDASDSNGMPDRQEQNSQPVVTIINGQPREPRPAPAVRVQTRERVERAERPERSERAIPIVRQVNKNESSDDD